MLAPRGHTDRQRAKFQGGMVKKNGLGRQGGVAPQAVDKDGVGDSSGLVQGDRNESIVAGAGN